MRILIADDEATTRRLLRAHLTAAGHEVLEAADGEAAWELLQREGVTFLVTDWLMPRLDGRDLIQRVRAAGGPTYVYTILLTARDSKQDTVAGLDSGADDYLTKPFHPDELRARVAIGARILALETSLREARDRYAYQATHDPLTGLFNRLAITGHAQAELARAARGRRPLSIALLDIDHFKQINDRHGHMVGDQALCHVARALAQAVRPYDWVGRWGGEEFLVVLAEAGCDEASIVAERLRQQIADSPLPLADGGRLAMTASIGVASAEPAGDGGPDSGALFREADDALYEAKRGGRNRVCCAEVSR